MSRNSQNMMTPSSPRTWWQRVLPFTVISASSLVASGLLAGDPTISTTTTMTADTLSDSTRYGMFGWLDHRSQYGLGVFPEPFMVDDSDLEVNEVRFDWLFTHQVGEISDHVLTAEIEKGFGNLTLEVEVPFEFSNGPGSVQRGFDNIDLGARYPIYQYVSRDGFIDSTFGVAFEVGIPMHTVFSKNAELVPKIFNDLKIGNFTMQAIIGDSNLTGPGPDGGLNTLEYGFVFGYAFQHPMQGVEQFIPVFELSGETELNHDDPGHNSLVGNIAFRLNLKAIGRIQPRLGIGYVFPMDSGARQDLRSGLFTSLVFEY